MLIAIAQIPFLRRHTEDLAVDLRQALKSAGHLAEILRVPFSWKAPGGLLNQLLTCRLIDLTPDEHFRSDVLIALEFPAYLIHHPNKILWLTHHRWSAEPIGSSGNGGAAAIASSHEICGAADRELLPEMKKIHSISATASYQLRRLTQLDALPLCPPMRQSASYYWERPEGYFWVSDRLSEDRWELLLAAMALCREPTRVRLGGPHYDRQPSVAFQAAVDRLGLTDRVEWRGTLDEAEACDQYGRSHAVLCPTRDETFPWPAYRAMLASKPLLTCHDSGAPTEIVEHQETGLIVDARPEDFAAAMDSLWKHPDQARALGASGRAWITAQSETQSWPHVIESLLS